MPNVVDEVQFPGTVEDIETNINKINLFDNTLDDDTAKKRYLSVYAVKELLNRIPHIIESDIDGIWKFEKRSDGYACCYGTFDEIYTPSQWDETAWGALYGIKNNSGRTTRINFPEGLFTSVYNLQITIGADTQIILSNTDFYTKDNFYVPVIVRPVLPNFNISVRWNFRAEGRWD